MILPGLPNPFDAFIVKDPWHPMPGDVPELQKGAFERWRQLIVQVAQTGATTSLMVYGEAGSGKTHLVSRVRGWLAGTAKPVGLVWAKQETSASHLWRNLRYRLVHDLLQTGPGGTPHLHRLVEARFPGWRAGAGGGGIIAAITGGKSPSQVLVKHLADLGLKCPLDRATRTVIPRLFDPEAEATARDWLLGEDLEADALTALGLPATAAGLTDADREEQSRQVVKSVCRLAGRDNPLCICFDQVEGLQTGANDPASLAEFAKVATELVEDPHSCLLVVTLIQPHILQTLEGAIHQAFLHRIRQHEANIRTVGWEQAVAITLGRLEAVPAVRQERQHHPDKFWPVGEKFLRGLYDENAYSLTPRHLIRACRDEFIRLQADRPAPEPTTPEPGGAPARATDRPGRAPADDLAAAWITTRNKFLAKPDGVQFDRVMEIGLPFLAELSGAPLVRVRSPHPDLGDVSLVFQPTEGEEKPVGVSCCNHEPHTLWRRLDRLMAQWQKTRGRSLGDLVVIRSAAARTTPAAQARLEALRDAGARVLLVEQQPLAALAAYQCLLTAAHNGKVFRAGKTVEVSEYTTWAEGHLSGTAMGFFNRVFVPAPDTLPSPTSPKKSPARTAKAGK